MTRIFYFSVVFFAHAFLSSTHMGYSKTDFYPGAETVYVVNHNEEPKNHLVLELRNPCNCEDKGSYALCPCWTSYNLQPTPQGDLNFIINFCNLLEGNFAKIKDDTVIIPTPHALLKQLKLFGLDEVFELVDGEVDPLEYLKILSEGKLSLAKIPNIDQASNPRHLYLLYIHDLVNHLPLWSIFSKELRQFIAERAKLLFKVCSKTLEKIQKDQIATMLFELFVWNTVAAFDSYMAVFSQSIFTEPEIFIGPVDITDKRYVQDSLEKILSFGMSHTGIINLNYVYAILETKAFVQAHIAFGLQAFEKGIINGNTHFITCILENIEDSPNQFQKLQRLMLYSEDEITAAKNLCLETTKECLGGDFSSRQEPKMSLQEFLSGLEESILQARAHFKTRSWQLIHKSRVLSYRNKQHR